MLKSSTLNIIVALGVVLGAAPVMAAQVDYANEDNPGQKVDIGNYVEQGKTTIVEVGTDYCPDCRAAAPVLDRLGKKNHDFKIVHLDSNPKGVKGVAKSPLRDWVGANYVPHYIIFGPKGKKLAESDGRGKDPRPLLIRYCKTNKVAWKGI